MKLNESHIAKRTGRETVVRLSHDRAGGDFFFCEHKILALDEFKKRWVWIGTLFTKEEN